MSNSREAYVSQCKQVVAENLVPGKFIAKYHRKGEKLRGVVVVFKDKQSGALRLGYSLCNKKDHFNKSIGLALAVNHAVKLDLVNVGKFKPPYSMQDLTNEMVERANKFFNGKVNNGAAPTT